MTHKAAMKVLGAAILGANCLVATAADAGYSMDDLHLRSAQDLFDVCSLDEEHQHHELAVGFCYGFFEGASHYEDALAASPLYEDIICTPADLTREQAVAAFTSYMSTNTEAGAEPPIDAIFRSLTAAWPCPD